MIIRLIKNKVMNELQHLSMNNVNFEIKIEPALCKNEKDTDFIIYNNQKIKYNVTGIDDVEFLISPNKGEPLKSLIKIASGGELSRIIELKIKSKEPPVFWNF